jgi:hypothetical protein
VRLVTFRVTGSDRDRLGALLDDDGVLDLTAAGAPASLLELLREGEPGMARVRELVAGGRADHALDAVAVRAPLTRPNSIRDFMLVEEHVRNSFGEVPAEW